MLGEFVNVEIPNYFVYVVVILGGPVTGNTLRNAHNLDENGGKLACKMLEAKTANNFLEFVVSEMGSKLLELLRRKLLGVVAGGHYISNFCRGEVVGGHIDGKLGVGGE
jgi:hypothetical protein